MTDPRPAIGHLVTPYLFPTGSWVHGQLVHAVATRPVVLTQRLENPEAFPFEPVYELPALMSPSQRMWNSALRWLGSFHPGPYRIVARRERIDLFHAHAGWEAARTAPAARRCGLPMVASFYGRDVSALPRNPYWRILYRRLFRLADLFLVEGPHLGGSLAHLGCPESKIRVVHLGVDLSRLRFRERSAHDGPVRVLMSCSLREKKGVRYAIEALAKLGASPRWTLRVLGDGPLRGELEEQAGRLGLGDRVSFEGYVPYETHVAALEEADLFLAPSVVATDGDTEGGAPVAVIEAQAAGLPVVATRHCDIPEVVRHGESGLLVGEKDTVALAEALHEMMSDPGRWGPMGRAGREQMEREFDAVKQVEAAERIYLDLLGRQPNETGGTGS